VYDPLWALCQELELSVTHHGGGSAVPDLGRFPTSMTMYIMEVGFYANRALWHLVMSGVFDRFPDLVFILTEQGSAWIPDVLDRMDSLHDSMVAGRFGGELGPSFTLRGDRASTSSRTATSARASRPRRRRDHQGLRPRSVHVGQRLPAP
jgi:hypothetical protein